MKSNLKWLTFILIFLTVLLTMSCVSAGNETQTNGTEADVSPSDEVNESSIDDLPLKNASFSKNANKNYFKGSKFVVNLKDENKTALPNKAVYFKVGSKIIKSKTDYKGNAALALNFAKGSYTVSCIFNETGFNPVKSSSKIIIITTKASKFKYSTYKAYVGVKNRYKVTLSVDGIPLANRNVKFTIHGVSYVRKTDSKGVAGLDIGLRKGTYAIKFVYWGEKNINKCQGKSKVYVVKGMPKKIIKANSLIYRHKTPAPFKIKLVDARGDALKNSKVIFTLNKKKHVCYTDSKGIAALDLNLNKGVYKLSLYSAPTSYYKKASKDFTIKIKPVQARNNGIWLWGSDMAKVNFNSLQKLGTKHIFLNSKAVDNYGRDYVEKFISKANSHKIKVHIWMQVFYNGKWVNPVKNGKINYDLINSKVGLAKKYANMTGVGGIHFDYIRYLGNAYKYSNGVKAVNHFTKTASEAIHLINPDLVVSAAVMPEPYSMKKYYGQDIETMSKYLDVIVPMIYKGNYNAGTSWIQKTTQTFIKKSVHAEIWAGIQTYKSDSNPVKLSSADLMNDADAAAMGGACGVMLFRYGLMNSINFNHV